MYCKNCGKEVKDGANNCPYCGRQVNGSNSYVNTYSANTQPIKPKSGLFKNAGAKLKGIALVIFFVNLIGGILLSIFLWNFSYNDEMLPLYILIGAVGGAILGWVSAIMLYSYGELCENVSIIATAQQRNSR